MARRGGNPRISIQADQNVDKAVRDAQGSLNRLERSADKTSGKLRGFATVTGKGFSRVGVAATGMAAAGAAGAALLAKSFVNGASDIQESLSKNRVLFGKYADDVDKFSQRSAKSFGISRQAALEYTGTFGNLFRATGVARGESAKFSVQLTKLAADMASFNNTSIEDALEAIRSGIVGETEPLRRFGVNLNDAQLRQEALRLGLVKTTKEALDPQSKALAAQALIVKQTSAAHGDFARTSGGLANQQRILKAQLADAGAELGGKLVPFALKAVRAVNSLFDSSTKGGRAIQSMGEWASKAAGWIKDAWGDAVAAVTRFVHRNREEIRGVMAALRSLGRFFKDIFDDVIVPAVKAALPPIKMILDGIITAIRGLVRIVSGILTGDWRRVWSGVKDIVGGALRAVKGEITLAAKALIPAMFGLAKKLIGALVRGLAGLADAIKDAIVSGVKKGVAAAGDLVGDIISAVNPFGDGIGRLAKGIGDGVGAAAGRGGGASLMGADPDLYPFARMAASAGLHTTSGLRVGAITSSGNRSYHATGDAIDVAGPPGSMLNFFRTVKKMFGSRLRELIYTPGGSGIKDGHPFTFSGQVAQDHYDHVHVAYTGPFGDGIGQAVNAARGAGFRGQGLVRIVAIAGAETGGRYNNDAHLVTSREDSRGMTQINVRAHPWAARWNLKDPNRAFAAAWRISGHGRDFSPWTTWPGKASAFMAAAQKAVKQHRSTAFTIKPRDTELEKIEAAKALAALTPGTLDDQMAAHEEIRYWRRRLRRAKRSGNAAAITTAATNLRSARDALAGFAPEPADTSGGGDTGGPSAPPTVETGAADLAVQLKRMNDFNDWLVNTQGPTLVGAVVSAVNGGIGQRLAPGLQGLRSPVGSVAGF